MDGAQSLLLSKLLSNVLPSRHSYELIRTKRFSASARNSRSPEIKPSCKLACIQTGLKEAQTASPRLDHPIAFSSPWSLLTEPSTHGEKGHPGHSTHSRRLPLRQNR